MSRCFQQYAKLWLSMTTITLERHQESFTNCGSFNYVFPFVTVPVPIITGSDVSVIVGSLAILTCSVSNIPIGTTATYQWRKDGLLLANLAMYQVSSSVNVSDAGVYICEVTVSNSANNSHVISGTGSVNVTLTVTSKWIPYSRKFWMVQILPYFEHMLTVQT